jgi:hypothetical protein
MTAKSGGVTEPFTLLSSLGVERGKSWQASREDNNTSLDRKSIENGDYANIWFLQLFSLHFDHYCPGNYRSVAHIS